MKPDRLSGLASLGAAALLLGGCATSALWEEGVFARYHEPAAPPNLQLFHSARHDDVLVRYDEAFEGRDQIKPRAYWLHRHQEPLPNPHKPRFVKVKAARGLAPIPLEDTNALPQTLPSGFHAVAATNASEFVLYSGEEYLGRHELPVYRDRSGRVAQVLLTPLTVVADLTIVGGIVFLQAWAGGGFRFHD
jgi:hypothetical protein